jgi:hypothetical protein
MQGEYSLHRMKAIVAVALLVAACRGGASSHADTSSSATPADNTPPAFVAGYYSAIQSRRYADAYALWSDSGRASGKTRAEFANGFAQTATVYVTVGDSVHIEGAAGSQYATVPVAVDATLRSGERQHFVGEYVLRRAMVDGATAEQRRWHIYSARLHP